MTSTPRALVINCGSSSIKYQLLSMDSEQQIAGGIVERIGESVGVLHHRFLNSSGETTEFSRDGSAADHREAFRHIGTALTDSESGGGGRDIAVIGHRVVHGGASNSSPAIINPSTLEVIRKLIPLAPLHNPANIAGIEICLKAFPGIPNVAVFDTAFHQTMPPRAYRYAVPEKWYLEHGVRRYGFHGTSHRYVAKRAADFLGGAPDRLNLITLHLGNGASAAAIERGRCVDTSMGFTPSEGLIMGTRSGDIDPAVSLYMTKELGASAETIHFTLDHESGLLGLCGTNDMRDILSRESTGDERARLALELYCYRIKKYIGAYSAALGRVDAIVFTGGVGENASRVRHLSCEGLKGFGIEIDPETNATATGDLREIGIANRPVRALVIRTNEELQIAREAMNAIGFAAS